MFSHTPPPSFQGAKQLYRIIVHPFLLKHEDQIDEYVTKAGHTGLDALRKVSRAGINRAATTVVNSAMMVRVCVCVCVCVWCLYVHRVVNEVKDTSIHRSL